MVERVGQIVDEARVRPEDAILAGETLDEGLRRRGFNKPDEVLIDGRTIPAQMEEVRDRITVIDLTATRVKAKTGLDLMNAGAEMLERDGNIQTMGRYNPARDEETFHEMLVHEALADDEKLKLLEHVALHEGFHKAAYRNARKRADFQPLINGDLEEIACEVRTSMETGQIRAYKSFLPLLGAVCSASGKSRQDIAMMYEEGKFAEMNECYIAAYPEALIDHMSQMQVAEA